MADVELLLQEYGQHFDERCPPVTVAELEHHLAVSADAARAPAAPTEDEHADIRVLDDRPSRLRSSPRRWKFVLVGAAAAAAAVLLVALVSFIDRSENGTVITDQPEPAIDNTTALPSPGADESGLPADPGLAVVELSNLAGTVLDKESLIPDVLTTDVFASTIGDLRWSVLDATTAFLGESGVVATPVGLAAVTSDAQLLISDDAVEWRAVVSPFPGRLERISEHGGEYSADTTDNGNQVQWVSSDFVTWTARGSESSSAGSLDITQWVDGPEFLSASPPYWTEDRPALGAQRYTDTPDGASLVYAEWSVDWMSLALAAGGDDLKNRLDNGEVLGGNSWDPATGIVEITIFENVDALLSFARGRSSSGPEPTGVQFRLSVSGTIDDWAIEFQDVARNESLGSITGSIPPLGIEESAEKLTGRTIDDIAELLVTGGNLGAYFLSSEDGLELVDHPPWVSLPGSEPTFVLTDDELYAYYDSGAWRSPDGRAWVSLDTEQVPTIHIGEESAGFFEGPGGVLLAAADLTRPEFDSGSPPPAFLRSDDGVNWAPPSQPPTFTIDGIGFSHLAAADSGFLFLVYDRSEELVQWTSVDGDIWERAEGAPPLDSFPSPFRPFRSPGFISTFTSNSNNLVTIGAEGLDEGSRLFETVWVLEIVAPR